MRAADCLRRASADFHFTIILHMDKPVGNHCIVEEAFFGCCKERVRFPYLLQQVDVTDQNTIAIVSESAVVPYLTEVKVHLLLVGLVNDIIHTHDVHRHLHFDRCTILIRADVFVVVVRIPDSGVKGFHLIGCDVGISGCDEGATKE